MSKEHAELFWNQARVAVQELKQQPVPTVRFCLDRAGWGRVNVETSFVERMQLRDCSGEVELPCPSCAGSGTCSCDTCLKLKEAGKNGRCLTCWGAGKLTPTRLAKLAAHRLQVDFPGTQDDE